MSTVTCFKHLWKSCLECIEKKISQKSFETWFLPIVPILFENNILNLEVPNRFFYEWIEENYLEIIKDALKITFGEKCKLEYSISKSLVKEERVNQKKNIIELVSPKINPKLRDFTINSNYNFDNFIEGECNRTVKAAAKTIAEAPGITSFNPFIIYGKVGIGKTHIAQAIGNHINKNFSNKKVSFISSEMFANQYVMSIRENFVQDFSSKFLDVDLLIVDDIQFFSGKEKTQEAFFHIFNYLHQSGKQLVMTSDTAPKDMFGLQERLLSRFKWGLTTKLSAPDRETKRNIALSRLKREKKNVSVEVLDYLGGLEQASIREVEGIINSIIIHSEINNLPINLSLVQRITSTLVDNAPLQHPKANSVSMQSILDSVSGYFTLKKEDIKSNSRAKDISLARKIVMHMAKNLTRTSLKSIGEFFGGKHHATVLYSIDNIEKLLKKNTIFKADYDKILKGVA